MSKASTALREYETIYILKPELDDKSAKDFMVNLKDFVKSEGGENIKVSCMGRRKLAWARNKVERGIFVNHKYAGNSETARKVDRNLTLDEQVMLRQTVKLDNLVEVPAAQDDELDVFVVSRERMIKEEGNFNKNNSY